MNKISIVIILIIIFISSIINGLLCSEILSQNAEIQQLKKENQKLTEMFYN